MAIEPPAHLSFSDDNTFCRNSVTFSWSSVRTPVFTLLGFFFNGSHSNQWTLWPGSKCIGRAEILSVSFDSVLRISFHTSRALAEKSGLVPVYKAYLHL